MLQGKGGKRDPSAAATPDDESILRDRYHEDVTEAIQMEEEEAKGKKGGKGGRKKYRQATQDR